LNNKHFTNKHSDDEEFTCYWGIWEYRYDMARIKFNYNQLVLEVDEIETVVDGTDRRVTNRH